MGGYLMQLQNFSVNDGDGIRTVVFMAGCPLRCACCANPEGQTCRNAMTHWAETGDVLKKLRQQEKDASERAAREYEARKNPVAADVQDEKKPLSGDAARPYAKGRAYDPTHYGKKADAQSADAPTEE